jgi:phage baseplate assembly protein W
MTTALAASPYGRDTSATTRIMRGRLVSGNRLLAEAIVRRLITSRGQLLDDPNYGFALVDLLSKSLTPDEEAAIPSRIKNEIAKDRRLEEGSISVTLTPTSDGPIRDYEIEISASGDDGPFELALSIDDLKVSVLSLPEAT